MKDPATILYNDISYCLKIGIKVHRLIANANKLSDLYDSLLGETLSRKGLLRGLILAISHFTVHLSLIEIGEDVPTLDKVAYFIERWRKGDGYYLNNHMVYRCEPNSLTHNIVDL